MKNVFLVLFFALSFIGCRTEDLLPPGGGNDTTLSIAERYYPLQDGNSWVFTTDDEQLGIMKLDVRGAKTINGKQYTIVEQSSSIYRYAIIPRYYRAEGEKVFQYDEDTKEERVVIDFSSDEPTADQYRYYVTSRGEIATVPAGVFTVVSTIAPATMYDGAPTQEFAENIGLVQTTFFRGRYKLHHAVINGKKIGKQ